MKKIKCLCVCALIIAFVCALVGCGRNSDTESGSNSDRGTKQSKTGGVIEELVTDAATGAKELATDAATGAKEIATDAATGAKEMATDAATSVKEMFSDTQER